MPQVLVIAGSRTLDPTVEQIDEEVAKMLGLPERTSDAFRAAVSEVVSGDAPGSDRAGTRWANHHGIQVHHEPTTEEDIRRWGKYMGPRIRNRRMAERGACLLAFWDAKSSGTADMVTRMVGRGKPATVVPMKSDRRRQKAA